MTAMLVPVEEFTTPDPITVTEEMAMEDVRALMEKHGIRHLPVLRGETVVGIVSDRDVRLVLGLPGENIQQVRVSDIMAPDPLTVAANTPLDQVAFTMSERKIGSVIVNEANGQFLGIFTASDALNALIEIMREGDAPTG